MFVIICEFTTITRYFDNAIKHSPTFRSSLVQVYLICLKLCIK